MRKETSVHFNILILQRYLELDVTLRGLCAFKIPNTPFDLTNKEDKVFQACWIAAAH